MSTMRFADEVVPRADIDEMPARRTKPEAKALRMATQLLDAMAADWKPGQYHDTYAEELRARIEARDAGEEVVDEAPAEASDEKVVDLMAALEASVAKARSGRRRAKPTAKRSAGRRDAG